MVGDPRSAPSQRFKELSCYRSASRTGWPAIVLTRVVVRVQVFEAQRTDGRHLGDVLTGFCPMEVRRIARQNNDATGRISLDLITVELIAQADVEDTGHDGIDSVLGVSVRHELHA